MTSISTPRSNKITIPLIIANETFDKLGSVGAIAILTPFMQSAFNYGNNDTATIIFIFGGLSNMAPLVGAILSDTYFGRFKTVVFSSCCSLVGMIVLTITTFPAIHPNHPEEAARLWQMMLLYTSLLLFILGAAGMRSCNMVFGMDQYDKTTESGKRGIRNFIAWNYASFTLAVMVSMTVLPLVQQQKGWSIAFAIPTALMFASCATFFIGSPLYVKLKPEGTPLKSVFEVFVASFRNRNLHISLHPEASTNQLRWLEKAALVNSTIGGTAVSCSIDKIEDAKCLVKVLIVWTTTIICQILSAQLGFYGYIQASNMNRSIKRVGELQEFPAASMGIFTTLSLTAWVLLYGAVIVPLCRKYLKKGPPLSTLRRMGIGICILTIGALVAAIVELKVQAHHEKYSVFYLVPQTVLMGLAEAFNSVAQIEFYENQLPENLASMTGALFSMGYAFGSFGSAILVRIVRDATKLSNGESSWMPNQQLDGSKLHCFYFLLVTLGVVNLCFFLPMAKWYKHKGTM
ncbi:Protein NRT1/ PTR FAMILY 2.9 [Linum grandiflorum]